MLWLSFLIGTPFVVLFLVILFAAFTVVILSTRVISSAALQSGSNSGVPSLLILLSIAGVICMLCCVISVLAIILGFISTQA